MTSQIQADNLEKACVHHVQTIKQYLPYYHTYYDKTFLLSSIYLYIQQQLKVTAFGCSFTGVTSCFVVSANGTGSL
jgi:hypothetical protein